MKKALSGCPWLYVVVFFMAGLVMTLYEAVKEALFRGTLSPWESHGVTILVTAFLAIFAALSIRSWSEGILRREQEVKLREQKATTMKLVLRAVHHIVNNFLNHFVLIKLEMKERGTVQEETLALLDAGMEEVKQQIKALEEIENPEDKESYREIYP